MGQQGTFVFPNLQEVWNHNKEKIMELNQKYPIAKLNAISQGSHSKSSKVDRVGGLSSTLFLCKDAKVTLTVNLSVRYSLFNRATGKIIDVLYLDGKSLKKSLLDVIMVEFHNYTGTPFIEETRNIIPIVPVER